MYIYKYTTFENVRLKDAAFENGHCSQLSRTEASQDLFLLLFVAPG